MFWNKKEDTPEVIASVSCDDCGCLIEKDRALVVTNFLWGDSFYCGRCKPPYDGIQTPLTNSDIPDKYWRNKVPCDKEGNIIGDNSPCPDKG